MRSLYFLRGCKNVLQLREIILKENKTLFLLFNMYIYISVLIDESWNLIV